jgi:hypothetical protein
MFANIALLVLAQGDPTSVLQSWEVPSIEVVDDAPHVFKVSQAQQEECREEGAVCMWPGGSDTILGVELADGRGPVTVLARGTQVAASEGLGQAESAQGWTMDMVARFDRRSFRSPVYVAVFDREDQESLIENTPMMLWTVNMEPSWELGMRVVLSPQDGFVPSRSYLVQVLQVEKKRLRSLAEGEVRLE